MSEDILTRVEAETFQQSSNRFFRRLGGYEPDAFDYAEAVPIGRDVETGELVTYYPEYHDRIGVFGTTGSGKTFLCKTIISRLFAGGMKVFHATDIKNDFHDIDNTPGCSKYLIRQAGYAVNEQRQPIPKRMFMPKFLADEYVSRPPSYIHPFTFGFEDMSRADLQSLLNATSVTQEEIMQEALRSIDLRDMSFAGLRERIEAYDAPENAKRSVLNTLSALENEQVVSRRFRQDPLSYLDEEVVVLALENWDRFKRSGIERIEMYIAVLLRRIKEGLRDGSLDGPVLVFTDEAHAFCPAGEDSVSKREFVDLVDLGRAYKVPMMFSTQHPAQLPNPDNNDSRDVVGSMNHFFLAPNLPETEWKSVLKASQMWRQYENHDVWRERFAGMTRHQWLYINKEKRSWRIIEPLAPLCAHTG